MRGKFRQRSRAEQRGKTEEDVDEYQKLADEELIQKLRGGDERIMDYILEKYKPLVLRKANAMFLIGGDTDDLIQEGMQWNALDEEQQKLRYQVPYVIWANYDIDEEQNADTSANYLGAEVLKRAGVPTDAYQNFLLTLKESYPVISAVRTVEADGSETPAKEEYGEMDIYRKLQYYFMFDWEEESGE